MTKQEFLDGLTGALSNAGSERIIRENRSFYNEYIDMEMKKGRSEEEVLNELGDPRLIANSIKEAAGIEESFEESRQEDYKKQEGYGRSYNSENDGYKNYEDIVRDNYNRDMLEREKRNKMILYGIIGGLIVVVVLLLLLATAVFKLLAPYLLPLIVMMFVFNLLKKK